MNDRVFLDTNIFVYAVDQDAGARRTIAESLILSGLQNGNAVVSYQVVFEFLNVALRKLARPLSGDLARAYLTTVFRHLHTVSPSFGLASAAIDIRSRYQLSWYDALIIAAALEAGCSLLLSEDLQHGMSVTGLRIENPFRTA